VEVGFSFINSSSIHIYIHLGRNVPQIELVQAKEKIGAFGEIIQLGLNDLKD
jgi:hypothetical protein